MEELKRRRARPACGTCGCPSTHDQECALDLEYATLCEIRGRSPIGAEPFNCSAPDTQHGGCCPHGTDEHKKQWLTPLLEGKIRSAFAMTAPAVASSDSHQYPLRDQTRRRSLRDQCPQVVDLGRAGQALQAAHLQGQTDPRGGAAPAPKHGAGAQGHAGREVRRSLSCSAMTTRARSREWNSRTCACGGISCSGGPRFRVAQGLLGRGASITACGSWAWPSARIESIVPARAYPSPSARRFAEHSVNKHWIAESRIEIDQARLLTMNARPG